MVSLLRALPRRLARRFRRQLEYRLLGHRGLISVPVGRPHAGGVIDAVEISDDNTLAVVGWSADEEAFVGPLALTAGSGSIAAANAFRVPRPDLGRLTGAHPLRMGIVVEYCLPHEWSGRTAVLTADGEPIAEVQLPVLVPIPYDGLYGNPGVLNRDHIYGVGPPVHQASSEILELCEGFEGPLLDFGCGAGSLVRALRSRGVDAHGLELDTPWMRGAADSEIAPHVTYYSGSFPAPFSDGAFRTVTCCEVLEHIPAYEGAIAELARITSQNVMITVPDMSAIPRCFAHGVVPWHLLESSHVNFFTQQSLGNALAPHFRKVQFFRIGEVRCERTRFFTSLVALCTR
jgi:hypothetical protein